MYLVPFPMSMLTVQVEWLRLDTSDFQAPKGMRYCLDKSGCWHRRRSMGAQRPPQVENRNVTWLVSNSNGFDRAIWRLGERKKCVRVMMGYTWFDTVKSVVNVGAMGAIATTAGFEKSRG